MRVVRQPIRTLDFDVEARPLGWYGGDFTHKEITVVAWAWLPDGVPEVRALSKDERTRRRMLLDFREVYDQADMVVGHFIRAFDIPLVSAMLMELGEPPLGQKLTQDTKLDVVKLHGVSKSQANLAAMLGVEDEKVHMTTQEWRESNRLTKDGVEKAKERAVFDVIQNMELRRVLIAQGLLAPPKVWRPS